MSGNLDLVPAALQSLFVSLDSRGNQLDHARPALQHSFLEVFLGKDPSYGVAAHLLATRDFAFRLPSEFPSQDYSLLWDASPQGSFLASFGSARALERHDRWIVCPDGARGSNRKRGIAYLPPNERRRAGLMGKGLL